MIYKPYQHIVKLGTSETAGILNGTCYLSYKIDGTNSSVWLKDDGTLGFGSRKRELNGKDIDNAKFMETMSTDPKYAAVFKDLTRLLHSHPNWIIYGEWLIPVNLKSYKADAWRQFYIFDIVQYESNITQEQLADDKVSRYYENYIPYETYSSLFDANYQNLKYIPIIAKLTNPTEEEIASYLELTGNFLIDNGLGEGIVIKNYDYKNSYGRRTWAKILTEDFKSKKKEYRKQKAECIAKDAGIEYEIIKLMTPEHIFKERSKMLEYYNNTDWDIKYLPELLNRAFNEFFRDNWELILKKFRNPIIDFRVLKQLSTQKIKETLGIA